MSGLSLTLLDGKPSYEQLEHENDTLKHEIERLKAQMKTLSTPIYVDKDDTHPFLSTVPTATLPPSQSYTYQYPHLFTPYHHMTPDALQRFSRHLILKQVSSTIQNKWLHSKVLIIGAGGLGAPVCLYLAAAGIGTMTLIDTDIVDESNLHRQVIHSEATVNLPKVVSAATQCKRINTNLNMNIIQDTLHSGNAIQLALQHDIIIDCTDNVTARYLTSDTAVLTNKPLISAAVVGSNGQLTTYCYKNGPCYRCVNPVPPPPESVMSCADAGVIGALVGVVGSMQGLEALKVLANIPLLNDPYRIKGNNNNNTTNTENENNNNNLPLPSTQFHSSWPAPIESTFEPLSSTMLFWDGCTSDVRKAKIRPRQDTCMCKELRPDDNIINDNITTDDIEQLAINLQTRTVEWACELAPKPVHKPPVDGADISSAPLEPKFRLDRIEPCLLIKQLQEQKNFCELKQSEYEQECIQNGQDKDTIKQLPYTLSPTVTQQLGNLRYPLLIDVRFIEQFQIVSVPSSIYCENFALMRNPNYLRDLLWDIYYSKFPQHCEENPKLIAFQKEIEIQDGVVELEGGETKEQRRKRYRQYELTKPSKYQLINDIINQINYASQQEQECILNLHLLPKTVIHSQQELSLTSPRSNSNGPEASISPTEKVIFNELEHLPVLHTSLLCRRGRWTMMLLDWFAKYMFTTYFHLVETHKEEGLSINLQQTIPTLSATFAYMSICCGFPPIILSDVFGGLTALTKVYPEFPTY